MTDENIKTSEPSMSKKRWTEYLHDMENAYNTLRNSMGSFTFDHDFAHVKGYMEGYMAGMKKMEHLLDL